MCRAGKRRICRRKRQIRLFAAESGEGDWIRPVSFLPRLLPLCRQDLPFSFPRPSCHADKKRPLPVAPTKTHPRPAAAEPEGFSPGLFAKRPTAPPRPTTFAVFLVVQQGLASAAIRCTCCRALCMATQPAAATFAVFRQAFLQKGRQPPAPRGFAVLLAVP